MKTYIRIAIIVGVVALVAFAVWKGTGKTPSVQQQATEFSTPTLVPLASVSPLIIAYDAAPADWATYTSSSFKVSYPSDWVTGPCGQSCTGWATPTASASFVFGIIESTGTIDELLKSAEPYLAAKEEVKAGANTWLKLTLQQPLNGAVITSHFIEHKGKLYEFGTASSDPSIIAVYGKMISSLVFTK